MEIAVFVPAAENNMVFLVFKCEIQSLHAEDDIFQGNRPGGGLRVRHVGIDNNEILLLHRVNPVLDQVAAPSLFDVTQLCEMVRVGKAGPVVFIFGIGDIEKLCVYGAVAHGVQRVSCYCHIVSFLRYIALLGFDRQADTVLK